MVPCEFALNPIEARGLVQSIVGRIWLTAAMVVACSSMAPARASHRIPGAPRIHVDGLFDTVVANLLDASPTFLRQYERIAGAPMVSVSVRMLPRGEESCCRARTSIRRYQSGAILAWVEIPAPRSKEAYAELLGHEFEHILEQIDLIDLDAQVDAGAGASRLAERTYETGRAQRAGLAVAREATGRW
jgi:hypothetical protein